MSKKIKSLFIVFIFILMPLVSIQPVTATGSFSNVDFEQPHHNYTDVPPAYYVNTTPEQPWKKTDIDFTGSVGDADEYSIGFSKKINLNGQLPGKLAAVEGSVELGFKIGIRYDISFGYEFGVDYYHWANDMAVSEGEEFTYCSYVEPDPDTFSLWADITIEPFIELWADIDVYLELAGYEIVDWDKSWSLDLSLPISVSPNIDLGALLEAGLLTPIGALYSTPKFGLGLGIPGRLEYGIGDWAGVHFDAGCGAYVEFQIRGLLESLLELTGDANARFDDDKSRIDLKYYDPGKENLQSINIHVPVGSAGKVVEILAHEFEYSIEPGILLSWDGFVDYGAYLHIPTPTKYVKVARQVTERVCDWLPWPVGKVCDTVTRTVFDFVEVAATVVPDIDWDWGDRHEIEGEKWIPFFNIPLLKSDSQAIDRIKVLAATDHPLSIDHTWSNTWNDNWTVNLGPSALRLSAYAGYALNLMLEGMLYSYYKPNDQIAGHPFNYYVGVDGDEAGDGTFGGSVAAGYSVDLKIPYMDELLGHDVWIELFGYDFNTSDFSNLDIPLFEVEYTVGYAAISLSGEAEFADLYDLEITQSANGFLGEWETEPFFSVGMSLDGKLFEVISMNLGEVNVDFLFKGTGDLTGNISASGAGSFDSTQMQWDDAGDINYANIYPDPDAEKGDIIDILINNLKYNLDLDLVIRVSAHLFASAGPLSFTHDFEIDLIDNLQADVNEDIQEQVEVTAGFTPAKITDYPEEATAGEPFLINWETSNSTTGQTRLQYGQTPYPRADYSGATSFKPVSGGGLQEHNTTIILNNTGIWYFLAYINSTIPPFNYYSKNITILVKPRLQITSIPENATAGEAVTIEWKIFGPSSVESTNLRISKSPNPMSDPGGGTTIQSGSPGTYSHQHTFSEVGTYYIVAHAQVDREGEDHFSMIHSIKILPNMTITVLPSPNNASFEFLVNWTILGADYIDRTYLEYSQNSSFAEGVYSTISQYGYKQNFDETVSLYVKGQWYFRVIASVNGIKEAYYSKEPWNQTHVDPFTAINPSYPANVSVNQPFKLYWWVFGFNTSVDKTQIYYDNDSDVLTDPLGATIPTSGNSTDYSDTFNFSQAARYYFQANFSVDGDAKSWVSDVISIDLLPSLSVTNPPVNATGFTIFNISYSLLGLNPNTTLVDLWYGESNDISSMTPLTQGATGGLVSGNITVTGLYYFALNLTFLGKSFWSSVFSFQIVPHIEVLVPWDQISDTNFDLTPGQFAIAGIPVTIVWVVRNTTTVNLTHLHFNPEVRFEPGLKETGIPDYYKYDFSEYKLVTGLITPDQSSSGPTVHVFMQNVTFYVKEFKWIPFKVHAQCDNKLFDYFSNSSGIPVYPAAEILQYNYTVVVDKQDIGLNPLNFSVTWGLGYELHNWSAVAIQNTPNQPGIVPYKVVGIKHANIHYMLNYDPICPSVANRDFPFNSTPVHSGPAYPAIFTDNITISSVGTYFFRIHVKYQYSSLNENFTYPQHINRSYWSPLYKINVISYGKYNTTVKVPKINPPPVPPVSYADYDGDGDLDMLIGNNTGALRKITLYFNDGSGNYTVLPPRDIITYAPPINEEIVSITAGNFDAFPGIDFIMTNESMLGITVKGYIYLNDGLGNFVLQRSAFPQDSFEEASAYAVGDLEPYIDGIADIVYYGYSDFRLYVDYGDPFGNNISGPATDEPPIASLTLTDLDGSPFSDLITGYPDGSVAVTPEFPLTPFPTPLQNITATFSQLNYPIVGDFNNDGVNDTVIVNDTGEVIITMNVTTVPAQRVITKAAAKPQGLAIGDFENDGDLDFVIGVGSNCFQFFFSNISIAPSTWPGFSNQIVSNGGDVLATGDFNNDTFLDISAYRGDFHVLHFLYNYVPPPTIPNIDVSYNPINQTINIENITVSGVDGEPINDTNAYFYWYTILDGSFTVVSPLANLTWNGAVWEALNVNVSYLPEGNYYINTTFGDKHTFGNNSHALTLSTLFTIDHYNSIYVTFVHTLAGHFRTFNITVDIVNSTYTSLGNITGMEASTHSYTIRNATGHNVIARNETFVGNFTWGNTTGIYRWEAINVSTAYLLPGDYFVTVNFTDYLGYDTVLANSSLFTVNHTLISTSTPTVTYEGNLTQMIEIRNINIESTYAPFRVLGKGRARNYTYYIYDNTTQDFTGLSGDLSWSGTSWYADVSVAALPEGNYYLNAFFKDSFNATVTTVNSSPFTVDHIIDLSSIEVDYAGFMVQEFNVSIRPESTWSLRGDLNDTEALTKTYALHVINGSTPLETGDLTWNGYLWTKIIDVSQRAEGDYLVQVNFADSYANITQNSSINSVYHYVGVSQPDFLFNTSTLELTIDNTTITSSYHGMVNNTNVIPTINSFIIFGNLITGNITGSLNYSSPWHKSALNLSSLMYSSTFTVRIVFEVNESFGSSEFEFWIPPEKAPLLDAIWPSVDEDGYIFLNWGDVSGSEYYFVYRDTSPISSIAGMTPIAIVTASQFQDIIASEGTYFYVIVAGNRAGNTSMSNSGSVEVDFPGPNLLLLILFIGIGAAVAVVSVIVINKRRKKGTGRPKSAQKIKQPPGAAQDKLVQRLNELEKAFTEGKISQSSYETLKKDLLRRMNG